MQMNYRMFKSCCLLKAEAAFDCSDSCSKLKSLKGGMGLMTSFFIDFKALLTLFSTFGPAKYWASKTLSN